MGRNETLFAVANGYLGMRGNVEEGRESFAHGTFVNGFHETFTIQHAEEAFGFARVGQTMVNVPDAKLIRLYVDDEPLLLSIAELDDYDRSLDFRAGLLTRSLLWRTPAGKRVRVDSSRMVSMTDRHLAVMTFDVTLLDDDAPLAISSQLLNRQDGQDEYYVKSAAMGQGADPRKTARFDRRVLEPQSIGAEADSDRMIQGFRCAESGMTLAVAVDHVFETDNDFEANHHFDPDAARMTYRVDGKAGRPVRLVKYVSYHTSRGVPVQELVSRCRRTLDRALVAGLEQHHADQRAWYDGFWERSDVEVEGPAEVQQAVRWNLFQLAQAVGRAEGMGVPAKGVTGSGYSGHYFWDTEIYTLPFFTYTTPQCARSALRFRYGLLGAARLRGGADDPARCAVPVADDQRRGGLGVLRGRHRAVPHRRRHLLRAQPVRRRHRRPGVPRARGRGHPGGDRADVGRPRVLARQRRRRLPHPRGDRARRVHHRRQRQPVHERDGAGQPARRGLRGRVAARPPPRRLRPDHRPPAPRPDEVQEWRRAADRMFIPFEEHLGIHPQDAHFLDREVWDLEATPPQNRPLLLHYHPLVIYRFQVIKQADVVLALFLRGNEFTLEQKRADFEYYDPITTGDSTLSAVVQSIIAAEVGYHELALRYFYQAAFVDLADLHANACDGVHVASTGGVWSALVNGFGGFRDDADAYTLDPRLPEEWDSLTFRITLQGARVRVRVDHDEVRLTLETGELAELAVRGKPVQVTVHDPTSVPLARPRPAAAGPPAAWARDGVRRTDGSVITASVPATARHPAAAASLGSAQTSTDQWR